MGVVIEGEGGRREAGPPTGVAVARPPAGTARHAVGRWAYVLCAGAVRASPGHPAAHRPGIGERGIAMYLTQGLHRAVQQMPDAPATMFGERVRTWRQHADRVARLAEALRGLGLADGSRVGILALNSDRYAELLRALPWSTRVYTRTSTRRNPAQ